MKYDLDLQYQKKRDVIVSDALSQKPDLIGHGPANKEENL